MPRLYNSPAWKELRARAAERDGDCALAYLLGDCHGSLIAHHIEPIQEGGVPLPELDGIVMLCQRHHGAVHGWRRRQFGYRRCHHRHRTRASREICERRLNAA